MANVDTIIVDAGKELRDTLRDDTTLCTLLGITPSTAKNYIFFLRPANQAQGFNNPRIVIELKPSQVGNAGNNPDSSKTATISFQINTWLNENPSMLVVQVIDRIITVIHNLDLSVTNSFGLYKVKSTESYPDPDKEGTVMGVLSVDFELLGGVE